MSRTVRTDNAARRLTFVYKGTKDFSLGNGFRIPVLVAGFVSIPVGVVIAWVLSSPIGSDSPGRVLLHALIAVVGGAGAALLLLRAVATRVDPLRPFRYWFRAITHELNAPRDERPKHADEFVDVINEDSLTFATDRPRNETTYEFDLPTFNPSNVASADRH